MECDFYDLIEYQFNQYKSVRISTLYIKKKTWRRFNISVLLYTYDDKNLYFSQRIYNYIAGIILNDSDNTGWRNKFVLKLWNIELHQYFFARQVKFEVQIKKANGNLQSSFSWENSVCIWCACVRQTFTYV